MIQVLIGIINKKAFISINLVKVYIIIEYLIRLNTEFQYVNINVKFFRIVSNIKISYNIIN